MSNTLTSGDALEQRRESLSRMRQRAYAVLDTLKGPPSTPEKPRHLILAARAGYALAKEEDGVVSVCGHDPQHVYCARLAAEVFPLPPKRVLREEPDPNHGDIWWRWNGGLEYRKQNETQWVDMGNSPRVFHPFGERLLLWASLVNDPYREVPDNGDE